jgi:hypothetical protein
MYYVICNKQNVKEDVYKKIMIKLLSKSIKYNNDNNASKNKIKQFV